VITQYREPPDTLRTAVALEEQRYKFDPLVADSITLPVELYGIVAIRKWKLQPGMFLDSLVWPRRYSSSFVWANEQPDPGNRNGVYACQLLDYDKITSDFSGGEVIGIVELTGRVIEHSDGIYRAECCRVLQFLAHSYLAERLSKVYGVPCVIADSRDETNRMMVNWLGSHNGIRCLQWNLQFPADLQAERLLSEVESMSSDFPQPMESIDIPEDQKDMGRWASDYFEEVKFYCHGDGLVIRNDAIKSKYPGGLEAFVFNVRCSYNDKFTLVTNDFPGLLAAALSDMAAYSIPWHDLIISNRWGRLESASTMQKAFLGFCLQAENRRIATPKHC
jgi:hypothetical protein